MIWGSPMDEWRVTNPFSATHPATDINHPNGGEGHAVYFMKAGTILADKRDDRPELAQHPEWDRGEYVQIDHGGGEVLFYCHFQTPVERYPVGALVPKRWIAGRVGSTGYTRGPHCHIRCTINGVDFDWYAEYLAERSFDMHLTDEEWGDGPDPHEQRTLTDDQRAVIQRVIAVLDVNANQRLSVKRLSRQERAVAVNELNDMADALRGLL